MKAKVKSKGDPGSASGKMITDTACRVGMGGMYLYWISWVDHRSERV